jgi:predicted transcriptional regulator
MSTSPSVSAQLDRLAVEDTMHPGLIGCDPNAQLRTIAWILADEQIHCLAIHGVQRAADGDRTTWGIVTASDIIRALDAGDWGVTARELVTAEFVTVAPTDGLDHVVRLMAEHEVSHVLVVEHESPVGIVSALDVARAAGRR